MQTPTKHLLSLDVGSKRIGLALASFDSLLPQTLGAVEMNDKTIQVLTQKITDNNVQLVIVGLPRGLNGQDTAQTQYVRTFVDTLKREIRIPIQLQDEALTSKLAEEELTQRDISYTREDVDALAATYILRDYIDENKGNIK